VYLVFVPVIYPNPGCSEQRNTYYVVYIVRIRSLLFAIVKISYLIYIYIYVCVRACVPNSSFLCIWGLPEHSHAHTVLCARTPTFPEDVSNLQKQFCRKQNYIKMSQNSYEKRQLRVCARVHDFSHIECALFKLTDQLGMLHKETDVYFNSNNGQLRLHIVGRNVGTYYYYYYYYCTELRRTIALHMY
jgi:hypothetical protein